MEQSILCTNIPVYLSQKVSRIQKIQRVPVYCIWAKKVVHFSEKEQNMIKLVLQENSLPSNSTQLRKESQTETDKILRKFRTLSGQVKNIGEHQMEIIDRISSKHLPLISSEGAEC